MNTEPSVPGTECLEYQIVSSSETRLLMSTLRSLLIFHPSPIIPSYTDLFPMGPITMKLPQNLFNRLVFWFLSSALTPYSHLLRVRSISHGKHGLKSQISLMRFLAFRGLSYGTNGPPCKSFLTQWLF